MMTDPRSPTDPVDAEIPRWLWQLVRVGLLSIILGGIVLLIILARGQADPPYAGRITLEQNPNVHLIANNQHAGDQSELVMWDKVIPLPSPPYTLEITARFSPESDPLAAWIVSLDNWRIWVSNDGYYRLPPLLKATTGFIHIRPAGIENTVYLDVSAQDKAVLRINREIAWQGEIPESKTVRLALENNRTSDLLIQHFTLYSR